MAPPSPPDWRSGNPLDWWFLVGETRQETGGEGRTWGIATQGFSAARRIQRSLNEYFAGRLSPALAVDAIMGDRTLGRLEQAAREHEAADAAGGYGQIRETIARDRRQQTISPLTLRWALWLAYVRGNPDTQRLGWDSVLIPARAVLPQFGVAPDNDRNASGANLQAVSWLNGVQEPPRPPGARSENSTPLGSTAPGQTQGQTVTAGSPVPSTPGAPTTGGLATTTPATTPTTAGGWMEATTAGVANKYLALGALGLVVVGVVAYSSSKGGRARRGSTTRTYYYGSTRRRYARR